MKKVKEYMNSNILTKIAVALAVLLTLVALFLVLTKSAPLNDVKMDDGDTCKTVVVVSSGDTLSGLLSKQGLTHNQINEIAAVLKKNGVSGLRADRDKIEFVRTTDADPVNKIVVIPSPWRQVELTCDSGGAWKCNTVEVQRDTRAVYKSGVILDGDSFYLAGMRAGIPAGILADVYDLLAFEMDFERDVRAGQHFSVLYEENFSSGAKVDNGHVLAVSFDALRGNVKMYRFKKKDGTVGFYD